MGKYEFGLVRLIDMWIMDRFFSKFLWWEKDFVNIDKRLKLRSVSCSLNFVLRLWFFSYKEEYGLLLSCYSSVSYFSVLEKLLIDVDCLRLFYWDYIDWKLKVFFFLLEVY